MLSKRAFLPMWRHFRSLARLPLPVWTASGRASVSHDHQTTKLYSADTQQLKTGNHRHLSENVKGQENLQVLSAKESVDSQTEKIQTAELEDVQNLATGVISVQQAALVLERLNQLSKNKEFDGATVLNSERLQTLTNLIHENIIHIPQPLLLNCLQSLLNLTKLDTFLIESMEMHVIWLLRKTQISSVVRVLELHIGHQETSLRRGVYRDALVCLEKRWVELSNPRDLVSLMYLFEKNNNALFSKLEERALDLAETMSPKRLYQILYLISRRGHRNTPLIRAISYHLNKSKINLHPLQLSNLLYACSSLSVYDINLLQRIVGELKDRLPLLDSHHVVCSALTSMAMLRWRQVEMIESFLEYLKNHQDQITLKELANLIISLAKLNYRGQSAVEVIQRTKFEKMVNLKEQNPQLWLDFVWSLAALEMVDKESLGSVLDPAFYTNLKVHNTHRLQVIHMKLLNIQTAACSEVDEYTGPKLPTDWIANGTQSLLRTSRNLAKAVVDALTAMAPRDRFVKTDIVVASGYFIDAELYVDRDGKPKPYVDAADKVSDSYRVCLRVLDFPDMTLHSQVPTGLHAMATRHLSKEGYVVIEIPYTDMVDKDTVVKKVQYLEKKLKKAVSKTETS